MEVKGRSWEGKCERFGVKSERHGRRRVRGMRGKKEGRGSLTVRESQKHTFSRLLK